MDYIGLKDTLDEYGCIVIQAKKDGEWYLLMGGEDGVTTVDLFESVDVTFKHMCEFLIKNGSDVFTAINNMRLILDTLEDHYKSNN